MNSKIILSICIASYNQGEKLYEKVLQLLSCNNQNFQIVVSDNCSTDNTILLLEKIKDERFKLILNTINKGPVKNYISALSNGDGKYVLFVTDKDALLFNNLPDVIRLLTELDVSTGYFALDCVDSKRVLVKNFNTRIEALINLAYLSKHPTGYFFNNSFLKQIDIENRFAGVDSVGYFPFEFICSELCMHGNAVIIEIPFCVTGKIIPNGGTVSATYSKQNNNLFFLPEQRFAMFEKYLKHLNTLSISNIERVKLLKTLTWRSFMFSTYSYKLTIENSDICSHYKAEGLIVTGDQIRLIADDFYSKLSKIKCLRNNNEIYVLILYCKVKENIFLFKKKIKGILLLLKK